MADPDRKTGTIARLFPDKVFGFIHCPEEARDYFFHQAHLTNHPFAELAPGDVVTFVVGDDGKGRPQAEEILWRGQTQPLGTTTRAQLGLPQRDPQPGKPRHPRRK